VPPVQLLKHLIKDHFFSKPQVLQDQEPQQNMQLLIEEKQALSIR